jgi:hypothetical protein
MCELAAEQCQAHVSGALDTEVYMVDFDGRDVVARG